MQIATQSFADINGLRLHYLRWHNAGAPVLLLVHGMCDHAHSWNWTAQTFANRFDVIAIDMRGHGDSMWTAAGAYTLLDYVSDLAALIGRLGLDRVKLVGHSMGGVICTRYAGLFPERVEQLCSIEGIEFPYVSRQHTNPQTYPARMRQWILDERLRRQRLPRIYESLNDAEGRMATEHPSFDTETIGHLVRATA